MLARFRQSALQSPGHGAALYGLSISAAIFIVLLGFQNGFDRARGACHHVYRFPLRAHTLRAIHGRERQKGVARARRALTRFRGRRPRWRLCSARCGCLSGCSRCRDPRVCSDRRPGLLPESSIPAIAAARDSAIWPAPASSLLSASLGRPTSGSSISAKHLPESAVGDRV
jgi:hypothetical protein